MLLRAVDIEEMLMEVTVRLQYLLSAVYTKQDTRLEPAIDLLREAVWQKNTFPFGESEIDINGDAVYNITSRMQGRVLTAIEVLFPAGQQCDALKSKASDDVWSFYWKMVECNLEPEEGPTEEPLVV